MTCDVGVGKLREVGDVEELNTVFQYLLEHGDFALEKGEAPELERWGDGEAHLLCLVKAPVRPLLKALGMTPGALDSLLTGFQGTDWLAYPALATLVQEFQDDFKQDYNFTGELSGGGVAVYLFDSELRADFGLTVTDADQ